jgi:Ca2+/H+ antiporter
MNTPTSPQKSFFRSPYLYSSVVLVLALAYVIFLFLSRHESSREFERRNAKKTAEQQRAGDRAAIAQLCYDVANAQTVSLTPPAGQVWPSHNRCLELSPRETTAYTLTIADASGKSASQSVRLQVR